MYQVIQGDLLKLAEQGNYDLIGHGCNCFNAMGAGIARQIGDRWPQVEELDQKTEPGRYNKLGTVGLIKVNDFWVANCYTQYSTSSTKPAVNYPAIIMCFDKLAYFMKNQNLKSIGLPLIGCGLAGGDWNKVEGYIKHFFENDFNCTVVEYNG